MSIIALPELGPAPDELRQGAHFSRALTQLVGSAHVVARTAIYSDKGIKLVESGARIDTRLYERLVQAPLREAIDNQLVMEDMVSVASIVAEAKAQCESTPLLQRLASALGGAESLLAPVGGISLPVSMAFKLTMMRAQQPALYRHSLQMMLVALYLAVESGWSERECVPLAVAALLHDVGMLYTPPTWNDSSHRLSPRERRQLMAHAVMGMHLLREQELYPLSVPLAVLEHHERMDGGGYPRGAQGAEISPMGQILMLAEVVAAFHEKYADQAGPRLSLMLRMNHRHYPADLVQRILPRLVIPSPAGIETAPLLAEVQATGALLAGSFALWSRLYAGVPLPLAHEPLAPAVRWLHTRLQDLEKELAQAGSHPQQLPDLLGYLQDDAAGLAELALLHREAVWQIDTIASNCQRDWPQLTQRSGPLENALAEWCEAMGRHQAQSLQDHR